ncbi:MAG: threonine ammonia-lyase [Clostridiaceae bacterium]|jgi:threonine dehydratase|nr:threonine ammonia-lyase [Clostridiaceae bacterium]
MELTDVVKARKRLSGVIHNIPLEHSARFSELSGGNVYLKCENRQLTGSFKVRGAYNKMAVLKERGGCGRVIAASAGNHAQGVAFAARESGIKATIVMPRSTPIVKVSATEGYGAEVLLYGDCYDDAHQKALEIQAQTGAVFIEAFDDDDVIAGQGTLGLEIVNELQDVDVIVVPAGGGGLLAGVAKTVKSLKPGVRIVGVQAAKADAIKRSFDEKKLLSLDNIYTIADGIAVKKPGKRTFDIIKDYADEVVSVTDEEIASTIIDLMERTKQVVEPAGAAGLAAVLHGKTNVKGLNVACVLSGGNIDVGFIHKIIEKGLIQRGRELHLSILVNDAPGSLAKISGITGDSYANITSVRYDRAVAEIHLNEVILHITCEVSGKEHGARLIKRLSDAGFKLLSPK